MPQYSNCWYATPGQSPTKATSTAQVGPLFEIHSSATDSAVITEIGINIIMVASGASLGVGVPVAAGVGGIPLPLSSAAHSPNQPTSALNIFNTWSGAQPTAPTNYFRRINVFANAFPATLVFRFPRGLKLAPASSLVLYQITNNFNQTEFIDFWVEWDG
jgi:hypothetical protein